MRRALVLLVLGVVGTAAAEVGAPCDEDGSCPPGEICLADAAGGDYCSAACVAGGCPEGLYCAEDNGVRICARGRGRAAAGEPCGAEGRRPCEPGTRCLDDGVERYCAAGCAGLGGCEAGFVCRGEPGACLKSRGLPGYGAPCVEGACAEGLSCLSHPSRARPFCTGPCEGECGGSLVCEEGRCVFDVGDKPGFGQRCVADGPEPALIGCAEGLRCHDLGTASYCTRLCGELHPCGADFGCVATLEHGPECRRGRPDDPGLGAAVGIDVPVSAPPPSDAGVEPSGAGGGAGGGCAVQVGPTAPSPWPMSLLCAVVLIRRRRSSERRLALSRSQYGPPMGFVQAVGEVLPGA